MQLFLRVFACLLLVVLLLSASQGTAQLEIEAWESVVPGIDYRYFELEGPNKAYVARMDRSNPNVTLDSSIAGGALARGSETVSAQFRRHDQALNNWALQPGAHEPGNRSRVVVAINGSYVMPNMAPQSGQVQSGWYAKRFDNVAGGSGFAWKLDRSAFIGGCVTHNTEKQIIAYPNGNKQFFSGINIPRADNLLILYTPQFDTHTPGGSGSTVDVLVEVSRPVMIMPSPASSKGIVVDIRDGQGSTPIPFDHVVLSASGSARDLLLQNVQVGDEIGISQEIISYENGCSGNNYYSWTKTYASISGEYYYLKDGQIVNHTNAGATARHPRTAIAYNDAYIYYIVIDGRRTDFSIGMTIQELGEFTRDYLGATYGIAEDGGGSSTMVINGVVKNRPTDPCFRIYLPSIANQSGPDTIPLSLPPDYVGSFEMPIAGVCERKVGNAMLMVTVEQPEFSTNLVPGESVSTRGPAQLRLGPGMNYAVIAALSRGTRLSIVKHANNLDGVLAKGHYWWKVNLQGLQGWIAEAAVERTASVSELWMFLR